MIAGIPVELRGFLKYAGCNLDTFTKDDRKKKVLLLEDIAKKIKIESRTISAENRTDRILRSSAMNVTKNFEGINESDKCNKDTQGLVTMHNYSRGQLFYVTSGGFIRYWAPLYKSESTSQVAVHTIRYLELYIREYKNIDDVFFCFMTTLSN